MTLAITDHKDGLVFTGAVTASAIKFTLLGGQYFYAISASDTTSELDILLPDGTTYQSVGSSTKLTTAAGAATVNLPPGSYQIAIASVAAVQGLLVRVPYRSA